MRKRSADEWTQHNYATSFVRAVRRGEMIHVLWYVVSGAPFQAIHRGTQRRGAGGVVVEPLLVLLILVMLVLVLVLVGAVAVAVAGGRPRRAEGPLQTRRQKSRRRDKARGGCHSR